MYRIIGLWNKGLKYKETPHNIGGEILFYLHEKEKGKVFEKAGDFFLDKKRKAFVSDFFIDEEKRGEILLPETFMNNSGDVLKKIKKEEEIEKIIVLHDDIDLPLNKVLISFNRGHGGHNGIRDIMEKIGSKKFVRIRIGVCPVDDFGKKRKPDKEYLNNYLVYKKIRGFEFEKMSNMISDIIDCLLFEGVKKSMNKFNS